MNEEDNVALQHFTGAPTDAEIEALRQAGKQTLMMQKEVGELYRQLDGLEWGSGSQIVKGSSFSDATRYAIAKFCAITGANPMTQVDILGGKPYLNVHFWSDRVANDSHFVSFDQEDISPGRAAHYIEQAKGLRESADAVKATAPESYAALVKEAVDYEAKAREIDDLRRQWNAPAWATVVVITEITRLIPAAPIEKIRAGELTDISPFLTTISEANWAGNRPKKTKRDGTEYNADPIGNEEPEKTARSRSFRRAATRSFAAWMPKFEQQVMKAQDIIEAEWGYIQDSKAKVMDDLPKKGEPQDVTTGDGDPGAAKTGEGEDLPIGPGIGGPPPADPEEPAHPEPEPEAPAVESPLPDDGDTTQDIARYRESFFGGLKAAGIPEAQRKQWAKMNGLPDSTKDWGQTEFQRAIDILTPLAKDHYQDGCARMGRNPGDLAQEVIEREPTTLDDYYRLTKAVIDGGHGPSAWPDEYTE